ncbi:MAG: T9SS type A sorting domain-containing protein, partial [Psychroflexus maritimus]
EVYIDNVYFSKESMSSEEFETEVGFSMYPNPAKDLLIFESKIQVDEVSIFDMSGRQVKSSKNLNSPLDISNLKEGVYMVTTKMGDHMVVRKLIKQ